MENATQFDLNEAVLQWRNGLELVGSKPIYRVVQIGFAADEILGPRRQRKAEGQRARSLDSGSDAIGCVMDVVKRLVLIARGVFDGTACRSSVGDPEDGFRHGCRIIAETILQVSRNRAVGRSGYGMNMLERLRSRNSVIAPAENGSTGRARCCECFKTIACCFKMPVQANLISRSPRQRLVLATSEPCEGKLPRMALTRA